VAYALLDLGPHTAREIEERLRHDIGQERLTAIDRRLLRRMDSDRIVTSADRHPLQQSLAAGRLRTLTTMGLAEDIGGGHYQLADGLEDTLRRMGERGDIIRTMQRELTRRRLARAGVDQVIAQGSEPVVGRAIHRGFADEHRDRHYLLVDGIDGRVHYVDIGRGDATEPTPEGSIVRVAPRGAGARDVDRTVVEVAVANNGRYSVELHLRHDPSASEAFAEAHVRRLEAIRKSTGGIEREPDGLWRIAPDHLNRVAAYEAKQLRDRPVDVEVVSYVPIERLGDAEAETWLDRELASEQPLPLRDAGFGREVRSALAVRRQWLVEQQLADEHESGVRLRATSMAVLQRRELLRVAGQLTEELSKQFVETGTGAAVEGTLTRRVELVSGRFALIEKSREFALVPWRSVLERQLGKQVSGVMRADGINWQIGRRRAGPEIS